MTEIRACTPTDIDAVLAFEHEWEQEEIAHVFVPHSRDYFVTQLTEFPALFWVAAHHDRLVGYINGAVRLGTPETVIPAGEKYVEIENLFVTRAHRHAHLGGQLIERLMAAARHQAVHRFVVGSNSRQMEKILAFYQRHGFKLWQVELYQ